MASDSARRKDHFQKKKLSKTDLPFKFCKIGLKNTLFIFGRKNGRLLFVVCCLLFVVCCCCCLLQLCPILAYFFVKPFLKGKILRSSERGVNSILTTILRF